MAWSSPTETSGFCYVFLFLALSALELIKWMICISCPALLLLPCSAKMITKRLSQIFLSRKISQLCEIKDAVLLQGWTTLCRRQNKGPVRGTTPEKRKKSWWRRWSQGVQKAKAIISFEIIVTSFCSHTQEPHTFLRLHHSAGYLDLRGGFSAFIRDFTQRLFWESLEFTLWILKHPVYLDFQGKIIP